MPVSKRFKTKEEYNLWMREYRLRNLEKMRSYNREYNRKWRKENGYASEERWAIKNPEKRIAQEKLRHVVRMGRIKKQPCATCGTPDAVGHHPDYSKPLEVVWLCKPHHRKVHYGNN